MLPLCAALALACSRDAAPPGSGGPSDPSYVETPICDPSDSTQVVAPQRVALLTSTELMNMIRLVSNDAAQMVIDSGLFPLITDLTVRFPPPRAEQIHSIVDVDALAPFDNTALAVGNYVRDNFTAVTTCPTPAADACATAYLDSLAAKVYRRPLTSDEQSRFTNLYANLRSQIVNGCQVTLSVEEATGSAVYALYMAPQVLWRWELGGGEVLTSILAVYLTDVELASSLSFFLTDLPPDDALLADAQAGTLRANLASHVDRILKLQTSRDWLRHLMEVYFFLNQLPGTSIDPQLFSLAGSALYADLQMEARLFLDDALWNGTVTDLVTSRKTFLNSNLATLIYDVPAPLGATPTAFVETTLPADQRSGLLTNAGFITTRARSTGTGLVPRGLGVKALFTCMVTEGEPLDLVIDQQVQQAANNLSIQTAQQQVAVRQQNPSCSACHASFDPYGLVLDWYDVVGRYRTVDDLGQPVDAHTTLPAIVGGERVESAVELADALAKTDAFVNCMASSMLQYALLDAPVDVPLPSMQQRGCAAAGIAHALRHGSGQSFTDLIRAVALSPAFVMRQQVR